MNICNRVSDKNCTTFDIVYLEGRANYRFLFGEPEFITRSSRQRATAFYPANKTVVYLRWRANEYGTQTWRCFVVRTAKPDEAVTRISGVRPGASILLSTRGKTYTKRFLRYLDALKKRGYALENVPPSYWRHLHLRLHLNLEPHPLSDDHWAAGRIKQVIFS